MRGVADGRRETNIRIATSRILPNTVGIGQRGVGCATPLPAKSKSPEVEVRHILPCNDDRKTCKATQITHTRGVAWRTSQRHSSVCYGPNSMQKPQQALSERHRRYLAVAPARCFVKARGVGGVVADFARLRCDSACSKAMPANPMTQKAGTDKALVCKHRFNAREYRRRAG